MNLEKRKITVIDEHGKPIKGVGTFPQNIVPGSKESNTFGELWVYPISKEFPYRRFRLSAICYESKWFNFDQQSGYCVLKRKNTKELLIKERKK